MALCSISTKICASFYHVWSTFCFSPLLPIFQLLIISVDQCTIECKVSSIVCSFIYCCRGKKMLDPSPFSLPKISPPHTHTHTHKISDTTLSLIRGKCFHGNNGGHILCLGPVFSQSHSDLTSWGPQREKLKNTR